MADPVLHDAVTLNHFGSVGRMDVLQTRHGDCPMPLWTSGVKEEIENGANKGHQHCRVVMAAGWLGEPAEIESKNYKDFYNIWLALNDGRERSTKNKGEAESIFVAEHTQGTFLTDDSGAYDFAKRRPKLAGGKVRDSIDVLRSAVAMGELSKEDACDLAIQIENKGRFFRTEHRGKITPDYFVC